MFNRDDDKNEIAEIAKNIGSGVAGSGVGLGCVAATGISGLSGAGIMTGLAGLGLGSAAMGIITTGGIAIGTAIAAKKLFDFIFD